MALLLVLILSISCISHAYLDSHSHGPAAFTSPVAPFNRGKPAATLDAKAKAILETGKSYMTEMASGSAKRPLLVQDIYAPTSTVWERILDFDAYAQMDPDTKESRVYKREQVAATSRIKTHLKVGKSSICLNIFINSVYDPSTNSLTWTLDEGRSSDLDAFCGYWYLERHPDNPLWTRAYFAADLSLGSWVPFGGAIRKRAMHSALPLMKKWSEETYAKQVAKINLPPTHESTTRAPPVLLATTTYQSDERRSIWRWIFGGRRSRALFPAAARLAV